MSDNPREVPWRTTEVSGHVSPKCGLPDPCSPLVAQAWFSEVPRAHGSSPKSAPCLLGSAAPTLASDDRSSPAAGRGHRYSSQGRQRSLLRR